MHGHHKIHYGPRSLHFVNNSRGHDLRRLLYASVTSVTSSLQVFKSTFAYSLRIILVVQQCSTFHSDMVHCSIGSRYCCSVQPTKTRSRHHFARATPYSKILPHRQPTGRGSPLLQSDRLECTKGARGIRNCCLDVRL